MSDSDIETGIHDLYDTLSRQIAKLRYKTLCDSPRGEALEKEYQDRKAGHAVSLLEGNATKTEIAWSLFEDARARHVAYKVKVSYAMEKFENPKMVVRTDIQARACVDWINAQTKHDALRTSPLRDELEQDCKRLRALYATACLQKDSDKTVITEEFFRADHAKEIYESEVTRAKYEADKAKADMNFELHLYE